MVVSPEINDIPD